MAKIATPLRYPGGKSSLSGFIKLIFAANDLMDGEYVEPYCGGAGIAMELLQSEFAHRVHLNDVDPTIHAFWWSVFNETENLCRKIVNTKLSIANWRKKRSVIESPENHGKLDLGFAAFYLNRVNRSGILSAGPIGGFEQDGEWNMDARFNRTTLVSMIQSLAKFKDRVFLYQEDAEKFVKKIAAKLPQQSLMYLDPPYVVKGRRLYLNAYEERDHVNIASTIQKIDHLPWVVSYDNTNLIRKLYSDRISMTYTIGYSANHRSAGSEIIIFSDGLRIPVLESPLSIHGSKLRKLLKAA